MKMYGSGPERSFWEASPSAKGRWWPQEQSCPATYLIIQLRGEYQHVSLANEVNRPLISVVICAHNPHLGRLEETLDSLRIQTMEAESWELILVDNGSSRPLAECVDVRWHPRHRIVTEAKLGLTPARLRGFAEAAADLVVMVDDDNVPEQDYLVRSFEHFDEDKQLGIAGGKSIPVYEQPPPPWLSDMGIRLACRDLGEERMQTNWRHVDPADRIYPSFSPVGAGMVIRRRVWEEYRRQVENDPRRRALDRTGNSLVSGGDNDIVMTALDSGWDAAYLPDLSLKHLIPKGRTDPDYLARLAEASFRSWILVLDLHGMRPWKAIPRWLLPLHKLRHYARQRAWEGESGYVRWRGICGQLAGRSLLR